MTADIEQFTIPCVLMRGGTSKAVFFHARDVPAQGRERDLLLKRVMGCPDSLQIDGLGGARLVTSKVALVKRSRRPDADVDYTFAQVDIARDLIGYDGNCGNVSAAVGPFAIDEGLVEAREPVTTVRIYNTNTGKVLRALVPVKEGKARVLGQYGIAGVPGGGAAILMDYTDTIGSKTGKLLPTGRVLDEIVLEDGRAIPTTVCDVANPCVFISAAALGIGIDTLAPSATGTANLAALAVLAEIQAKAGALIGLWPHWRAVAQPGLPLAVVVAPPASYCDLSGAAYDSAAMDLQARLVFLGACHESMAATAAMCTAVVVCLPGSVVRQAAREGAARRRPFRIAHPSGVMEVEVEAQGDGGGDPAAYHFPVLGLARTARRLMEGCVYVPRTVFDAV